MNSQGYKLIILVVCWFFLTAIAFWFSPRILPKRVVFSYYGDRLLEPDWLWNRASFDSVHYLWVAKNGYGVYQQPFFPLYPLLIREVANVAGHRELIIGLAISLSSLLGGIYFLYELFRLDVSRTSSLLMIGLILVFPTSFIFLTVYTEAIFLFFSVLAFYSARRGWWWLAGFVTALATATRPTGIILAVALFVEWLYQYRDQGSGTNKRHESIFHLLTRLLPLAIMPVGLFFYLAFLYQKAGDPLSFIHLQPMFGANRSATLVLPYQVAFRYLKIFLTVSLSSMAYHVALFEFVTTFLFSFMAVLGLFLRLRPSYLVYLLLGIIVPSLSGTLSSEPRYLLVLFPGFVVLGLVLKGRIVLRRIFIALSLLGLVVCNLLFAAGYWIV